MFAIANDSDTAKGYIGADAGLLSTNGFPIPAGRMVAATLGPGATVFGIAKNTGSGVQTTQNLTGVTSSGTAANPANAKASVPSGDSVYANIAAAGQDIHISGFSIVPTASSSIQNVLLSAVFKKQASQVQTVAHQETQVGATAGAGTVVSASMAGGIAQLYVAEISRNDNAGTVTSVTAGGLIFTPVVQNITSGNRRIDLWQAYGTFTAGACTATLQNSTNAHIACHRFTGADPTGIQASGSNTGTGTAVTGPAIAGTNKGFAILAVSHTAATATPGAGYTERSDATNGAGSNTDSLATETL